MNKRRSSLPLLHTMIQNIPWQTVCPHHSFSLENKYKPLSSRSISSLSNKRTDRVGSTTMLNYMKLSWLSWRTTSSLTDGRVYWVCSLSSWETPVPVKGGGSEGLDEVFWVSYNVHCIRMINLVHSHLLALTLPKVGNELKQTLLCLFGNKVRGAGRVSAISMGLSKLSIWHWLQYRIMRY